MNAHETARMTAPETSAAEMQTAAEWLAEELAEAFHRRAAELDLTAEQKELFLGMTAAESARAMAQAATMFLAR